MHGFKKVISYDYDDVTSECFSSVKECNKCLGELRIVDTRVHLETGIVKRKRKCVDCGNIFTTYEIRQEDLEDVLKIASKGGKFNG